MIADFNNCTKKYTNIRNLFFLHRINQQQIKMSKWIFTLVNVSKFKSITPNSHNIESQSDIYRFVEFSEAVIEQMNTYNLYNCENIHNHNETDRFFLPHLFYFHFVIDVQIQNVLIKSNHKLSTYMFKCSLHNKINFKVEI